MNPTLQHVVNIGAFFFGKARANQVESGTYQAARNLRKQGVPLPIALDVLARKAPRYGVHHTSTSPGLDNPFLSAHRMTNVLPQEKE